MAKPGPWRGKYSKIFSHSLWTLEHLVWNWKSNLEAVSTKLSSQFSVPYKKYDYQPVAHHNSDGSNSNKSSFDSSPDEDDFNIEG